jgi:hypothetical protein
MTSYRLGTIQSWTGDEIRDRIKLMFGQVYKSLRWPATRTIAVQMILEYGCPGQNVVDWPKIEIDKCEVAAIYWGYKLNSRYTGDVFGIDTYQTLERSAVLGMRPSPVLASVVPQFRGQMKQWFAQDRAMFGALPNGTKFIADCDDSDINLCALLASVGFRVGAKCYSDDGRTFGHVVACCEIPRYAAGPKFIVPLDATEYEAYPGWEPGPEHRRAEKVFWYSEGNGG